MKEHKPKLKKCPYCNEKITYIYKDGERIAIEGHYNINLRWNEHTCYVELPNKK